MFQYIAYEEKAKKYNEYSSSSAAVFTDVYSIADNLKE